MICYDDFDFIEYYNSLTDLVLIMSKRLLMKTTRAQSYIQLDFVNVSRSLLVAKALTISTDSMRILKYMVLPIVIDELISPLVPCLTNDG